MCVTAQLPHRRFSGVLTSLEGGRVPAFVHLFCSVSVLLSCFFLPFLNTAREPARPPIGLDGKG